MLLTLVAAFAAVAAPPAREVTAAVQGGPYQVTLALPGFAHSADLAQVLEKEFGDRLVLGGEIDPPRTVVAIVASRDTPHRSAADRRGKVAGSFELGDVACSEVATELPDGSTGVKFEAHLLAAGFAFELRAITVVAKGSAGFSRRDFEELASSLRVGYARLGAPTDQPREVRDALHRALCAHPGSQRALQAELARRPDDAALAFAAAELLILDGAKPAAVLEAHSRALELWSKLRTPTTEQRFAWMVSEEAVGVTLSAAGKHADGAAHLRKSWEIAGQLRSSARPAIAYETARACAQAGDLDGALQLLGDAVAADTQWRRVARGDKQLAALADDRRFQLLTR